MTAMIRFDFNLIRIYRKIFLKESQEVLIELLQKTVCKKAFASLSIPHATNE